MMQWYADYLDALGTGMSPSRQAAFARRVNATPPHLALPHDNETDDIAA